MKIKNETTGEIMNVYPTDTEKIKRILFWESCENNLADVNRWYCGDYSEKTIKMMKENLDECVKKIIKYRKFLVRLLEKGITEIHKEYNFDKI